MEMISEDRLKMTIQASKYAIGELTRKGSIQAAIGTAAIGTAAIGTAAIGTAAFSVQTKTLRSRYLTRKQTGQWMIGMIQQLIEL